jgi:hypothetical protein
VSRTPPDNEHLLTEARTLLEKKYKENDTFNTDFDVTGPISFTSAITSNPYEIKPSEYLFWTDADAYREEKLEWESSNSSTKHQDVTDLIAKNSAKTTFHGLLDAVGRGRIVPFVGAGMSRPMGMPLWGEALQKLLIQVPTADSAVVQAHLDAYEYLEAAETLYLADPVKTKNFIQTTYRLNTAALMGPLVLIPQFAHGCVVTTNFDDAIEKIYKQRSKEFDVYMYGGEPYNFFERLASGGHCLLKLHGDAEIVKTYVFTKSQYDASYGRKLNYAKPLAKVLRQIYISHSLLFLGCSLEQDKTLALFQDIDSKNDYHIPMHYAILPEPADPAEKSVKESRLLGLKIHPIWYPTGEHGFVEKFLQLIVDVQQGIFSRERI